MGRVDSEKNVDVLLEAFLDSAPPRKTKLLIMGTGTEKRRLERFYKDARVIFTGQSDPEGRVRLDFTLPEINEGNAALIVQVNGDAGSSEMKFLIKKR